MKKTKSDFLRFIDDQINSQRKISLQKAMQNREKFQELLGNELELSERITSIESHLSRISRELKVPAEEVLSEARSFFDFMPKGEEHFIQRHLLNERVEFIQAVRRKPVPDLPNAALATSRAIEALYSRYHRVLKEFIKGDIEALEKYGIEKTKEKDPVLDEETGLPKLKSWLTRKDGKCPFNQMYWPLYSFLKTYDVDRSYLPDIKLMNQAVYQCWQLRNSGKPHTDAGRSQSQEKKVREALAYFVNNDQGWEYCDAWMKLLGSSLSEIFQANSAPNQAI